jgi:transposase
LNPRQRESGKTVVKQTIISRVGSASLRAALYMPAVSALQHNPIIRDFATRLRQRGVRGKAVVVAAMRKLLHLVVGVLKSGRPFDPSYIGRV